MQSLLPKSRKPLSHPNQHTREELELIERKYKYFKKYGNAQVYRKCRDAGYTRSFGSMCKQLKKLKGYEDAKVKKRYFKSNFTKLKAHYPGEFVEVDVKYVPLECIGFSSNYDRYYQITAIDLDSRKRVLKFVNEHSTHETSKFLLNLEQSFGFKIKLIQTDKWKRSCK